MNDNRGQVGEALAAVRAALDVLADAGPWQASDAGVAALVVETEVFARRLAGVQLAAIAEGITRGLPFAAGAGTGASAPGRWVRSLISVTPGDAGRRAALAETLFTDAGRGPGAAELAPTRDAVLAGQVSTAHATHVVDAVRQLSPPHTPAGVVDEATRAEAQALLLSCATGSTGPDGTTHAPLDPTQVAKAAMALTATLDPGQGDRLAKDEDAQYAQRAFTLTPLPSGMCHAAGLLTKTAGHALMGVLQSLSAPQPAADGTPDPRTAPMRTHDGLEAAVRLLQGLDGSLPGAHGSPHRLVVSVDVHTLAAHLGLRSDGTHQPEPVRIPELPGRWPLSPLATQVMSCDADLVAVLIGPDGTPLDVADTSYPFTTKQRTAVIDRDRHCTYGTCTAPPAWCHVHHLQPFSRGGPTTVANAALLCGVHHRHVHAHHLTGTRTSATSTTTGTGGSGNRDGTVIWHAPTGTHPTPTSHQWPSKQRSPHWPPAGTDDSNGPVRPPPTRTPDDAITALSRSGRSPRPPGPRLHLRHHLGHRRRNGLPTATQVLHHRRHDDVHPLVVAPLGRPPSSSFPGPPTMGGPVGAGVTVRRPGRSRPRERLLNPGAPMTDSPSARQRVFTGLKPTGRLQLGNYLGAIRPVLDLAADAANEVLVCVVDLHALTVEHDPARLRADTREMATTLLACGLDASATLFVRSAVPAHTELSYLLECTATYGEMQRMVQFKEKGRGNPSTRLSLLTYPALMAADILLHRTDVVPVGDDQRQHLELAIALAPALQRPLRRGVHRAARSRSTGRRAGQGPT